MILYFLWMMMTIIRRQVLGDVLHGYYGEINMGSQSVDVVH